MKSGKGKKKKEETSKNTTNHNHRGRSSQGRADVQREGQRGRCEGDKVPFQHLISSHLISCDLIPYQLLSIGAALMCRSSEGGTEEG